MASEVYMDKGMCKSRKTGSHRSTKMLANKKMGNYGNCVLNALLVLEDSVSTYLKYY